MRPLLRRPLAWWRASAAAAARRGAAPTATATCSLARAPEPANGARPELFIFAQPARVVAQPVEARVAFGDRHVNYACEWVGGKYVPQENVRQSASGPIAVKPGTVVNPMRADAQEFI